MNRRTTRSLELLLLVLVAACESEAGVPLDHGPTDQQASRAPVFNQAMREQLRARGVPIYSEQTGEHATPPAAATRTTVEQKWIVPGSPFLEVDDTNPDYAPHQYSVHVDYKLPKGTYPNLPAIGSCSGTLVGSKTVLTAAHCAIEWKKIGVRLDGSSVKGRILSYSLKVRPRRNGNSVPYGPVNIKRMEWDTANWPGSMQDDRAEHDYAVFKMGRTLGVTPPLQVASVGVVAAPIGTEIQAVHYPGGPARDYQMFYSIGKIEGGVRKLGETTTFLTSLGVEPGTSGAGIFQFPPGPVVGLAIWEDPTATPDPPGNPPGTRQIGQRVPGTPNAVLMFTPTTKDKIEFLINTLQSS